MSELPEGWDLDRVRAMGLADARLLPLDTLVLLERRDAARSDYDTLSPTAVLACGYDLCLVRNADDGLWYMGSPDGDGTIVCWGSYGDDLAEAIRGL